MNAQMQQPTSQSYLIFYGKFYSMNILTFCHFFFFPPPNRVHLTSRMQTCCFPLWLTSLVQSLENLGTWQQLLKELWPAAVINQLWPYGPPLTSTSCREVKKLLPYAFSFFNLQCKGSKKEEKRQKTFHYFNSTKQFTHKPALLSILTVTKYIVHFYIGTVA